MVITPFAVSPLNLRLGYALQPYWEGSVGAVSIAALILSIAIGAFAVILLLRGKWWRVLGLAVLLPGYGVLWFGNQLDYGCRLFMSCL